MYFFSTRIRPFFRTLAVIATCLWLSLILAYVVDKATDPVAQATVPAPDAMQKKPSVQNRRNREPTAAQLEERKDQQLYGDNYVWDRRSTGVVLAYGDMSLLCDFRSDFMNDMKTSFGDRINRQEMEAPTHDLILTEVIKEMTKTLRRRGQKDTDVIAQTIAEYLACLVYTEDPERYRWRTTMKAWK